VKERSKVGRRRMRRIAKVVLWRGRLEAVDGFSLGRISLK
jgi:hypothetical protein